MLRLMLCVSFAVLVPNGEAEAGQQAKNSARSQNAVTESSGTTQRSSSGAKRSPAPTENSGTKAEEKASESTTSLLLKYVPDDVVVVGAIQPSVLLKAKTVQDATQDAQGNDILAQLSSYVSKTMHLELSKVVEAGFYIDRASFESTRTSKSSNEARRTSHDSLRRIGLAMHNFEDAYKTFPDDDGIETSKGNLSWRVHLLPYLDQGSLYNQFHLDEPWDSKHNKTLIDKMPDVFNVPGVTKKGMTSLHLLTGEGTPFGGDKPPELRSMIDGTQFTILTVLAGSDKADVWTKPGGLEIDPAQPLDALGNFGDRLTIGLADGRVLDLNAPIAPTTFLRLAQHADGQSVEIPKEGAKVEMPAPAVVICYSEPFDTEAILQPMREKGSFTTIDVEGIPATQFGTDLCVMFPDPQTMLIARATDLSTMLAARRDTVKLKAQFAKLFPSNAGALVYRLELSPEQSQTFSRGFLPQALVEHLKSATIVMDATDGKRPLIHAELESKDARAARELNGAVNKLLQVMKDSIQDSPSTPESLWPMEINVVLSRMLNTVVIESKGRTTSLDLPKAKSSSAAMEDRRPASPGSGSGSRRDRNPPREFQSPAALKQIAMAVHDYETRYGGMPTWNFAPPAGENRGLSWRVHLLPFIGQDELYQQFKIDEPWDSEHNKLLVEKMPNIFLSDGVNEAGKTSFHVFLGENTPIGGDTPLRLPDIRDGMANTLFFVQAGPDTAEIWTKPSGLKYDAKAPRKCLGKTGRKIVIALGNGQSLSIDSRIKDDALLHLIDYRDGAGGVEDLQ